MALDTSLLKPAQIGTSEIATKNDISTSLAAYNPAEVINTNTTTIDGGKDYYWYDCVQPYLY